MDAEYREENSNGFDTKNDRKLSADLKFKLAAANCFTPAPFHQVFHMLWVIALYAGGYTVLLYQPAIGIKILALVAVAFASVQAGMISHEAGHGATTKKHWVRLLIGLFFNTFLTALTYSHFRKIHISHHSYCNNPEHDMDMQSSYLSLYPQAVGEKRSWFQRFITRYQAYLIWPLVTFQGFTLKVDSLNTLRHNSKTTRLDQFVLVLHLLLWFGLPVYLLGAANAALNYFFLTWLIGPYLGVVFIVNHIGTQIIEADEHLSFFRRNLIVTRDLGTTRIENMIFGGMNNHIEHHMFPSIPTTRLTKAKTVVKAFCKSNKLPYREMSWVKGLGEVFTYLNQIALSIESQRPVRDPGMTG